MEATPTSLALLADNDCRKLTATALGQRVLVLHTQLEKHQQLAAVHGCAAVQHAVALGQVFEEAFKRFEGEFESWLSSSVGVDENGKQRLSLRTAFNYRTLYKKRSALFPADGSAPTCRSLTDAYIKVGIIPAPLPGDEAGDVAAPVFRLSFTHSATPPEEWSPADRQAYLDKTAPIVELREKIEALAE